MFQQIRRTFVALGLTAALFLAAPSPSSAAGLRNSLTANDFAARVWAWLEGLLPGSSTPVSTSRKPAVLLEKEGSMIDPNGRLLPTGSSAPTSATSSDQGSAIDPDGK